MERLIARVTPFCADRFQIKRIARQNGKDVYTISAEADKIVLGGSSGTAIAAAYYRALRECCGMDLSFCGNRAVYDGGAFRLPEQPITQTLRHDLRCAMTYESFACEACAWDRDAWDWALDFWAMQGVNAVFMPVGWEAVWYYAALDLGVRREDAMQFLSSPNYFPLQMSGKLDSFLPLTDTNYLKARIELGQHILERMRELEIEPILPALSGHVPKYFKGYRKNAGMFFVTNWGQFPFTYRLFPDEPLFGEIAAALMERQQTYFGAGRLYLADPFYGVSPRGVRTDGLYESYGKVILHAIRARQPQAVWLSHACDATPALTDALPDDAVCILDADGVYAGGKPCVRGVRMNHGGHSVLTGDAGALLRDTVSGSAGRGVFSEYTLANPLPAAFAYRRLTEDAISDGREAFVSEAVRRWGSDEACLREAAGILYDTCYGPAASDLPPGSIPACRPSTVLSHTAPGDTLALRYDNRDLCRAVSLLLASEGDYTDGYLFDVCDTTRQLLSNYARRLFTGVIEGYQARDGRLFEMSTNAFLRLLDDLDSLLRTRPEFCLHTHLHTIGGSAEGKTDAQNFEVAFLASLTLFGPFDTPEQYDRLWKEWSDLVGTYYAERWHAFFALLAEAFPKRGTLSTECPKQIGGRNPQRGSKFYKALDKLERKWVSTCTPQKVSEEDTLETAAALLEKYKPMIESDLIQ